ncbi:MAG: hypothetical protein OCD76_23625 [Reichenbachiella sp.]
MKKKSAVLALIILVQFNSFAQDFPYQYFSSKITWLGLDYSQVRLIGVQGFSDPDDIVNRYFDTWNEFVITEPKKYNVKKYLYNSNIEIDLTYVSEKNKINPNDIIYEESKPLSIEKLQEALNGYDFSELSGYGTMIIVESYDKNKEQATYHFLTIDLNNNNILDHKKLVTFPSGFGFRNYWAYSFLIALQKTESHLDSMWWKTKKARKKNKS